MEEKGREREGNREGRCLVVTSKPTPAILTSIINYMLYAVVQMLRHIF